MKNFGYKSTIFLLITGMTFIFSGCKWMRAEKNLVSANITANPISFCDTLHMKILNPWIKKELVALSEFYKKNGRGDQNGLVVSLQQITTDKIVYTIKQVSDINISKPFILCKPVDGRPVILVMDILEGQFSTEEERAIEVLKNLDSMQYKTRKEIFLNNRLNTDGIEYHSDILDDSGELQLTFDHNHILIRTDTLGVFGL